MSARVGIFTIPLIALQIAAAAALRQNAAGRGWLEFMVLSLLVWVAVLRNACFTTSVWTCAIPLHSLGLLALLLPLLPVDRQCPRLARI